MQIYHSFYFNMARLHMPATIFIDQFDQLPGMGNEEVQNTYMHQLLLEVDAMFRYNQNIVLIAATNAIWNINTALFRFGRFNNAVFLPSRWKWPQRIYPDPGWKKHQIKITSLDEWVEKTFVFIFRHRKDGLIPPLKASVCTFYKSETKNPQFAKISFGSGIDQMYTQLRCIGLIG